MLPRGFSWLEGGAVCGAHCPEALVADRRGVSGAGREVRALPRAAGYPREVLRGGGLGDQFALRQRAGEGPPAARPGLCLEEAGGPGDFRGRDGDRAAEPPEQRRAGLAVLEHRRQRSGIRDRAPARFANSPARHLLEALGEIRCAVEQAGEGKPRTAPSASGDSRSRARAPLEPGCLVLGRSGCCATARGARTWPR